MSAALGPEPARGARDRAGKRAVLALAVLAAALVLQLLHPAPADAAVTRLHGFRATVDGWTSWYGSYGMGELGPGWCIDHGSRAPDPAYAYAPADLSTVPEDVRSAVAWVVGRHGQGSDPVTHAAVMLAVHDLMGARYPSGRLDIDRLGPDRMAGFGPHAGAVLTRARQMKADGLAHRTLRGPLVLRLAAGARRDAGEVAVTARVVDQRGAPVPGVAVTLTGLGSPRSLTTGADGAATTAVPPAGRTTTVGATATVPRLPLDAWAPTTTPAQRIARPSADRLEAAVDIPPATGRLRIDKSGDATAWVPITGARFTATPIEGGDPVELVVGEDGSTPEVDLPIGTHRVLEVAPPAGYRAAGPWTVEVRPAATTVLEVLDEVERATLRLRKVDAATGQPLGFAGLTLRYDADADGAFDGEADQVVAEVLSTREPIEVPDLLPGRYELREDLTPTGYEPLSEPLLVDLAPGQALDLDVPNEPTPTAPPPTTTTTAPPPTTSTTAPPEAPTTAPPPRPPVSVAAAPGPIGPATLPRTGVDTASLGLAGLGLVLLGWSGVDLARWRSATRR
ncbi:MAG: collagen binding domain-containing protein [Acidimicrobiia bacterium]